MDNAHCHALRLLHVLCMYVFGHLGAYTKGTSSWRFSQQQALAPYRGCPELPSAPFLRQKEGAAVLG